MTVCLNVFRHAPEFPATATPPWSAKVERWYQLDHPAYAIAQSYSVLAPELGPAPSMIILASPRASNDTDFAFASGGATSPSKFVHTLPNIRAVPLLQVMEWAGPLLCVQNDPSTVRAGIEQALLYLTTCDRVWVLSFDRGEVVFHVLTQEIWGANPRVFENRQQALDQL